MINKIVTEKMKELLNLCSKYKVKQLFIFGSACTDKFSQESDLDFLVEFADMDILDYSDYFFDLREHLKNLFNRKIDLLTVASLENPYLIEKINQTKEAIYAA